MRRAHLLLAALAAGCSIDFERYRATPPDGSALTDASTTDAPTRDAPVTPVDAGPPCTAPYVIAAVENLSGASGAHGNLVRVELATGRRCRDLGGSVLPEQPLALHRMADGKIAVASRGQVNVFDTTTEASVLSVPVDDGSTLPTDVFPIMAPEGAGFGVAYLNVTTSDIRMLRVFTLTRQLDPLSSSPVPQGTVSVTAHPRDATALLAGKRDTGETFTVRPSFTGGARTTEPFASAITGLRSVFALPREAGGHVVWATASSGSAADGAMRLTTPSTGSPPFLAMGPTTFACAAAQCREVIRVAADPTSGAPIAVCETAAMSGGLLVRHVVRADAGGNCLLLDGATLPARSRIAAIAVQW
ncbi:MAG: hypothetical protein U0326_24385 [Polyangiales bacterium]